MSTPTHTQSLADLPDDCIIQVLLHAGALGVVALRQTCTRLSELSRLHTTWRSILQDMSNEGKIINLPPEDLEASAEELEELAVRHFRFRNQIRKGEIAVQCLQDHRWESPPILDSSHLPIAHKLTLYPNPTTHTEFYTTGQWISPGILVMGSLVRPIESEEKEYGYVSVYDIGYAKAAEAPGGLPLASYKVPSLPGSAAELFLSKGPVLGDTNTYLVLVGTWTRTSWALIRLRLPLRKGGAALCDEIAAFSLPRSARKTALDIEGDLIVFASDISSSLGSIFLWNWREETCLRFRVHCSLDRNPVDDGSGPILIAGPYLVYIRSHTSVLQILRIPNSSLLPLATYDLDAPAQEVFPSWCCRLPWRHARGTFQLFLERDQTSVESGNVTVNIGFCKPGLCASAKLVITKGQSRQEYRPGRPQIFDFQVMLQDKDDRPNADIKIGIVSIPGSTGWLTPEELETLLRHVIKFRTEPGAESDETEVERRVPVSRNDLQTRVAIDPVLGRFCVLPDGYPGLFLSDVYRR